MIEIKVEDKEVKELLDRCMARAGDLTPVMREASAIMLDAVEENLGEEGRPRWPSLHPRTIKERSRKGYWPGRILQRTGRLASNIHQKYDSHSAIVGTNTKYAAIHQFGGKAGKGKRAIIPARPFLKLQDEDVKAIVDLLKKHLTGGL